MTDAQLIQLINATRRANGWSISELARRVGTSQPTMTDILAGKRPLTDSMVGRIMFVLDGRPAGSIRAHAELRIAEIARVAGVAPTPVSPRRPIP